LSCWQQVPGQRRRHCRCAEKTILMNSSFLVLEEAEKMTFECAVLAAKQEM
jgi:hypothetical protein